MPSTGLGLKTRTSIPASAAYGPSPAALIVRDYLFGLHPVAVTDIPYLWLRRPLAIRQDPPTNDQRVTRTGGGEYRSRNQASIDEHNTWAGSAIDLDTQQSSDPQSLATFITDLHADERDRAPQLTFDLLDDTTLDDWARRTLLARTQGHRILITDSPSTWPAGMERLTIEGVRHEVTSDQHLLIWNTSPMLGAEPGDVGPWFQLDITPVGTAPSPF